MTIIGSSTLKFLPQTEIQFSIVTTTFFTPDQPFLDQDDTRFLRAVPRFWRSPSEVTPCSCTNSYTVYRDPVWNHQLTTHRTDVYAGWWHLGNAIVCCLCHLFAISVWKSEHLSQKKGLNRGGSVWDQESGWKLWRAAPLPADRVPLSLEKECSLLSAKLAQRILECAPPWGVAGDRGQSLQSRSASLPLQHFSCSYPDEWDLISAPCVRRSFCLSAAVRSGRDLCSLVVRDCRKRVTRKVGAMVTRTRQKDFSEKPNIRKKNNNRI